MDSPSRHDQPLPDFRDQLGSAGIFLVLRRMRAPLIVLVLVFAVSMLGLSLMPGVDGEGRPHRMGLFEAFYFMAYTATTIGFGEIPHQFSVEQRMWVTFAIFLSVIGWAYAIGSLLALGQDTAFRRALGRRSFARAVRRIGEPFLLLVGYGNAAKSLARSLDDMGRRFVVVDIDEERVARVELDAYTADAPALVADARDTGSMVLAALGHRNCEGVIALSGDDETNLDVTMTTALLRPDLPVIARTSSRDIAARMRAFDAREVVNPLDRFGDHLRIQLRSPAAYQLMVWLTSAPGTPLPPRLRPAPRGKWVVGGDGRFGRELSDDLRAEGLEVTVLHVEGGTVRTAADEGADVVRSEEVRDAAAFVAATENDTLNLWLVDAGKHANPDAYVVALQNRRENSSLFRAVGVDFGLYPAEVIAHEVLARIASPMLMRFLPKVPRQGEEWADRMVRRLLERCGTGTPYFWRVRLDGDEAPAVIDRVAGSGVRLADLLRDPADRSRPLGAVPLVLVRGDGAVMGPDDTTLLTAGDELLLAGGLHDQAALRRTLTEEPSAAYVLDGRHVPVSWVWRRLTSSR